MQPTCSFVFAVRATVDQDESRTALHPEARRCSLPARLVTVLHCGQTGAIAPALVEDLEDADTRVRVGRHRVRFGGAADAHFEETS